MKVSNLSTYLNQDEPKHWQQFVGGNGTNFGETVSDTTHWVKPIVVPGVGHHLDSESTMQLVPPEETHQKGCHTTCELGGSGSVCWILSLGVMFICINLSADERGLVSCVPHCGHDYEMKTKTPGGASYHAGITGKHMICFTFTRRNWRTKNKITTLLQGGAL